mgnify:CR=1 FL=1
MLAKFPLRVFCPVACLISCDKHISLTCAIGLSSITHTFIRSYVHIFCRLCVDSSVGSVWYVALPALNTLTCTIGQEIHSSDRSVVIRHTHEPTWCSQSFAQSVTCSFTFRRTSISLSWCGSCAQAFHHARSDQSRTRISHLSVYVA